MRNHWKALLGGLFVSAVLAFCIVGVPEKVADQPLLLAQSATGGIRPAWMQGVISDAPKGYYHAIVESSYVNNATLLTGTYTQVSPPTNDYFDLVQIIWAKASGDETVNIRFWASATDSTTIYDGTLTASAVSGQVGPTVNFPVHCKLVSLTGVDNTDDFYVIGYVRDH